MKKLILTLMLTLGAWQWMVAETVDEFLQAMKADTTLEYVEVTPDMIKMMLEQQMTQGDFDPDDPGAAQGLGMLEGVSRIEILTGNLPIDGTPIKSRLAALTVDGVDEMVNSNEGDELSHVWMQTDGTSCKLIVVAHVDGKDRDWAVVKVDCDIPMDENFDLDELIKIN